MTGLGTGRGVDPTRALRQRMVERLERSGACSDPAILAAFRAVPRHRFLPEVTVEQAYDDRPHGTLSHEGVSVSSVSQPTMVAQMLQSGSFGPGDRVLEVGTGRGYNAALLGHLVGADGVVVTVDIEEELVEFARTALQDLGLLADHGLLGRVQALVADGRQGWPDDAPYDRIIVTAGADEVAPEWIGQLKDGGRLIVPLSAPRECVIWAKREGQLVELQRLPARFVPIRAPQPE